MPSWGRSLNNLTNLPTSPITNKYSAADVARYLGVKRMSVHEAVTRGKTLCAEYALLGQKRENNLTNLPTSPITLVLDGTYG